MGDMKKEWDRSYENRQNFLFYPHEEVIRFVSKFIRKRIGLHQFADVVQGHRQPRLLDLGCGIGRHVVFCHGMGIEAYGVDLSDTAIDFALQWGHEVGMSNADARIVQGDSRHLPWRDSYFEFAVSHGVLDSMPLETARAACLELARVMKHGGLFYCDLISGDDSRHAREFAGEEIVTTMHEEGTVQLYFNLSMIQAMIDGAFGIEECNLIRRENVLQGGYSSRYHLVLKRI